MQVFDRAAWKKACGDFLSFFSLTLFHASPGRTGHGHF